MKILQQEFYLQNVDEVAKQLIGKQINFNNKQGIIFEAESYCENDPASHSYLGKRTTRTITMFQAAGTVYVYLIYGMYYCFNIVTGQQNCGEAVLIRGVINKQHSPYKHTKNNYYAAAISGPGRVCNFLGITKFQNNQTVINNSSFFVADIGLQLPLISTTRIGINKAVDSLRRFSVKKEDIINYLTK